MSVAVVIPIYKENLNEFEKISLAQVQKVLGKYPIIFFAPEGKNFSYTKKRKVVHFPQQFFQGVAGYNTLMLSPYFYEKFLEYDYILIYQLDAFVFSDKLEYFCSLGYDYIGAPWLYIWNRSWWFNKPVPRVGNGGFTLRKVKVCYNLLANNQNLVKNWRGNEDIFFSYCGFCKELGFKVAPVNIANEFSAEFLPERCTKKDRNKLPFGCHGWSKYSADFYAKTFQQFGYNLESFESKLSNEDLDGVNNCLNNLASNRLIRRLQKGQSVLHYLPTNNFSSIRVIRNQYTNLILARLIMENNKLADNIYFYDENEKDILIHDLKPEKQPHLIISIGGIMI